PCWCPSGKPYSECHGGSN
ncbi:SEC-C metal-binding domain-containing protein, partial [Streptomyces sp. XY533]